MQQELAKQTGLADINVEHVEEVVPETAVFLMMSSRNSISKKKTKILIVVSSMNSIK